MHFVEAVGKLSLWGSILPSSHSPDPRKFFRKIRSFWTWRELENSSKQVERFMRYSKFGLNFVDVN